MSNKIELELGIQDNATAQLEKASNAFKKLENSTYK